MYASSVAEWRYGVRCARGGSHAGCGLCALTRAEGARARERGGRASHTQHRRWYCTAVYCGRGGSRHFRRHRRFIPEGSFRGHYPKYTSSNAVWLKVLGCAPLSPEIENCWGPRTNEICAESLRATGYLLSIFLPLH